MVTNCCGKPYGRSAARPWLPPCKQALTRPPRARSCPPSRPQCTCTCSRGDTGAIGGSGGGGSLLMIGLPQPTCLQAPHALGGGPVGPVHSHHVVGAEELAAASRGEEASMKAKGMSGIPMRRPAQNAQRKGEAARSRSIRAARPQAAGVRAGTHGTMYSPRSLGAMGRSPAGHGAQQQVRGGHARTQGPPPPRAWRAGTAGESQCGSRSTTALPQPSTYPCRCHRWSSRSRCRPSTRRRKRRRRGRASAGGKQRRRGGEHWRRRWRHGVVASAPRVRGRHPAHRAQYNLVVALQQAAGGRALAHSQELCAAGGRDRGKRRVSGSAAAAGWAGGR